MIAAIGHRLRRSRPRRRPRRFPSFSPSPTTRSSLVLSRASPGRAATRQGSIFSSAELVAKRLELLRELVPAAARVAVLVNPANAAIAEPTLRDVEAAARAMGLQIQVFNASTSREINAAFATLARERPDALFVGPDPFFTSPARAIDPPGGAPCDPRGHIRSREYVEAGGLMSYGTNITDAWRQAGVYAGRILKGAKPADLPVVQSSKFELVINAQTARCSASTVPPSLLARADEVIE